jgi:hypothetical protein
MRFCDVECYMTDRHCIVDGIADGALVVAAEHCEALLSVHLSTRSNQKQAACEIDVLPRIRRSMFFARTKVVAVRRKRFAWSTRVPLGIL